MLFLQGFRTAESLASKIVPIFNLCDEQLSPQPHYDFGLRALKAVLASAGVLKRERMQSTPSEDSVGSLSDTISGQIILIQSVMELLCQNSLLMMSYCSPLCVTVIGAASTGPSVTVTGIRWCDTSSQ
jgi:hypothetical protein